MTMFQRLDPTTRQRSRGATTAYSYSFRIDTIRSCIDLKDEDYCTESGSWGRGYHCTMAFATRAELTNWESMVE